MGGSAKQLEKYKEIFMAALDLSGNRYGNLTVIQRSSTKIKGNIIWDCLCDCSMSKSLFGSNLKRGGVSSCGSSACSFHNKIKTAAGTTHGSFYTREYKIWSTMLQRCNNPNSTKYYNYGARGIKVCDEWINSFESFIADMGIPPSSTHTIDRKDNDGNYEPSNCRWATPQMQAQNTRSNVLDPNMVKIILWMYKVNKLGIMEISRSLTRQYGRNICRVLVANVVHGKGWININIDAEIKEYYEFGTVNGQPF